MKTSCYLCLRASGPSYNPTGKITVSRVTKTAPALERQEIAIRISLDIPEILFTRSALQADITIPESTKLQSVIDAETIDNIENAIKQQTGVDVKLTIEPEKE
jgi:hypothetical protein